MCFALFVAWLLALLPGMGLLLICFACCGVNAVLCAGFAIVGMGCVCLGVLGLCLNVVCAYSGCNGWLLWGCVGVCVS